MKNFNGKNFEFSLYLGRDLRLLARSESALTKHFAKEIAKCSEDQLWDISPLYQRADSQHPLKTAIISAVLALSAIAGGVNTSTRGDVFVKRDGWVLMAGGLTLVHEDMRQFIIENPALFLKRGKSGTSKTRVTRGALRVTQNSEWEAFPAYRTLLNERDALARLRKEIRASNSEVATATLERQTALQAELAGLIAEQQVLEASVATLTALVEAGTLPAVVLSSTADMLTSTTLKISQWDEHTDRELGKLGATPVAPTERLIEQIEEALAVLGDFYTSVGGEFEKVQETILNNLTALAVNLETVPVMGQEEEIV